MLAEKEVLLLCWGRRDQRQPLLTPRGTHTSRGNLCRLEVQQFRGRGAGGSSGRGGEDFRFRGSETASGLGRDRVDRTVVMVQVWMGVHHWCGCSVVQQPLIRRGTAAAADGAGSSTEGNPRVGGGVLVKVGLTPAMLVRLMLVIVMVVVVCPEEGLLTLAEPSYSSVCRLLAGGLLRNNRWAVDVVILHVR